MSQGTVSAASPDGQIGWHEVSVQPIQPEETADVSATAVAAYLATIAAYTQALPAVTIADLVAVLRATHIGGGMVFVCGNGGSAAAASHLASDLARPAGCGGAGVRALCLSDNVPMLTAWANDAGYAEAFAGPLRSLARRGDALLVMSVSGSSPNVVAAAHVARSLGLRVAGLTGGDGGELRGLADVLVCVPSDEYGVVESVHAALLHAVAYALRWVPDGLAATVVE